MKRRKVVESSTGQPNTSEEKDKAKKENSYTTRIIQRRRILLPSLWSDVFRKSV